MSRVKKCPVCQKGFTRNARLKLHLEIHNPLIALQCNECKKIYQTRRLLDNHINIHHAPLQFVNCNICNKKFDKRTLNQHMATLHSSESDKVHCLICGKILKNKNSLRGHMRSVHGAKRTFNCSVCGRNLSSNRSLTNHICKSGNSKFNCGICKDKFKNDILLKEHMVNSHRTENVESDISTTQLQHLTTNVTGVISGQMQNTIDSEDCPAELEELDYDVDNVQLQEQDDPIHFTTMTDSEAISVNDLDQTTSHMIDEDMRFLCKQCNKKYFDRCLFKYHINFLCHISNQQLIEI